FQADLPSGSSKRIFQADLPSGSSKRIFQADLPSGSSKRIFQADLPSRFFTTPSKTMFFIIVFWKVFKKFGILISTETSRKWMLEISMTAKGGKLWISQKYMFEQAGQFSKDLIRIRDNTKLETILMLILGSD
ncbi:hypothetical protein, partial [Methanosarcina sp.]